MMPAALYNRIKPAYVTNNSAKLLNIALPKDVGLQKKKEKGQRRLSGPSYGKTSGFPDFFQITACQIPLRWSGFSAQ